MEPELWVRARDLFDRARALPVPEQEAFVHENAEGDSQFAAQVLRMLESDRETSFLDGGFGALADELLNESYSAMLGPYRRGRCLGQGGMGVVFLAEHTGWHIPVAIKVPRDAWISPENADRFAEEQRTLAQLSHPGIARIYEGGAQPNGSPWFAMEYVEGEPITKFAAALDARDRIRLFRQACEAVHYAHSQLVIHRDLKPSNMYVTAAGRVKLLDFGIARQIGEMSAFHTRTGQQPYTLAYAAPEQVRENRVSFQSDIYSLGVTLYELLTGRVPFPLTGLTPGAAEQVIATKPPTRPSEISTLPLRKAEWADLNVLVLKAMHKDPEQRYRTVDALIRDLDHFLAAQPLDARPDRAAYRISMFVKRNRTPVLASASVLLLTLALVGYFTWSLAQARDEAVAQAKREHAIQQFMTDLFQGGDSVNGPSKDLRVIDMLGIGERNAEQLQVDPLVQADLYNTLGTVYQAVGNLDKAGDLLHRAFSLFVKSAGPNSPQAAETLAYLSKWYSVRGFYPDAERTAREALAIESQRRPVDAGLVTRDQLLLADVLINQTRYDAALTILKQAGNSPQYVAENLNLQSTVAIQQHRYRDAERLTRQVIALDRRNHQPLRPDDAEDLINLAQIYEMQLHYAEAEPIYREALAVEESWSSNGNPEVANVRRLLAQDLHAEGKNTEAAAVARQSLAALEKAYGPWHRRVAYVLRLLGLLAFDRGDMDEARADILREIAIYKKIGNREALPMALSNLADIDVKEKNYRAAQPLYEQAIQLFQSTGADQTLGMAHAELVLGEIRVLGKQYAEAEQPLQTSLQLWHKLPVLRKQELGDTCYYLAKLYDGLNQHARAAEYRRQIPQ